MSDHKRLKIVRVSAEAFAALFKRREGRQLVFEGLPDDAALVDVSPHPFFGEHCWALKFRSAQFPEVPEGGVVPELALSLRAAETVAERAEAAAYFGQVAMTWRDKEPLL